MRDFKAFEGRVVVIDGARRDASITETASARVAAGEGKRLEAAWGITVPEWM